VRAITTVFSLAAISLSVPGLVLLQFKYKPRMFADKHDLGIPDPVEDEEPEDLTGVAVLPVERGEPPGSPWLWWNPVLSGVQEEPPDHRTGWFAGATKSQSVLT
jgi:hypothetical protein